MLKNEKGEASYISVFIYILVAVILIASVSYTHLTLPTTPYV